MRKLIDGITVIISHQERILNIADKVILMKEGHIVRIGDSAYILENEVNVKKKCCKLNPKGGK